MILWFRDKRLLQRCHALGHDDGQSEGLREGRDVAHGHDARELRVALRLADEVHERRRAAAVDDELGELGGMLGHLANARGGVLAHEGVAVLEAVEDVREDLRLDDHLRQVHAVLGDLRQAAAHLPLQLGVGVHDERREVRHRARIHDRLRQLRGVLADVAVQQGAGRGRQKHRHKESGQRNAS